MQEPDAPTISVRPHGPVSDDADHAPGADPLGPGALVGRYELAERIGAGGMGVVYAARDPQLDRTVAIKLVRPSRNDGDDPLAPARLLREAQAMAQLQHPNVVPVFDAGRTGDHVYLAMERVVGVSLRQWLVDEPRPWSQIVAAFAAAGRGLAAAHEAGIVHRDFKPANVIVADSGSVRVLDFGLAYAASDPVSALRPRGSVDPDTELSGTDRLSAPLTRVGHVMGTPRYMAPEQHTGVDVDGRTDQYAFCVALFHALFGVPPYRGATTAELLAAKLLEQRQEPVSGAEVPRRVRRAVERGLAAEPNQRHATMPVLLARLEPGRSPWRVPLTLAVLGGAALGGAGVGIAGDGGSRSLAGSCSEVPNADGLLKDAQRQAVRQAIEGAGTGYAADTWQRVEASLRAWTTEHAAAFESSCNADAADESAQLQRLCLVQQRRSFDAAVVVLAEAEEGSLTRVSRVLEALPDPSSCADPGAAISVDTIDLDPAVAVTVADVRGLLARAAMLEHAGRWDDAVQASRRATAIGATVPDAALAVEVKFQLGSSLAFAHRLDEAEPLLAEAVYEAEAIGHERIVVVGATRLTFIVGRKASRYAEGIRWGRLAQAHLPRIADDGEHEGALLDSLGAVYEKKGEPAVAEQMHRKALALHQGRKGPDSAHVAVSRNNLGLDLYAQGQFDDAIAEYRRVVAIRRVVLGPRHPDLGVSYNNLGNALMEQRRLTEARSSHSAARKIWTEGLGPRHPYVAVSMHNLGNLELAAGNLDQAERLYRDTVTLRRQILGPDNPELATTRLNLGALLVQRHDYDGAEVEFRAAQSSLEAALGDRHPNAIVARSNLAELLHLRGDTAAAIVEQRVVLQLRRGQLASDHPMIASTITALARMLAESGEAARAAALLNEAVAIYERGSSDPLRLAAARFDLAQLVDQAEPARGIALADLAAATFAQYDEAAPEHDAVVQWLATRR